MRKVHLRRPSPAFVVALLALFVALGGSASAAFLITGRNVKDGSLTGRDVKNGSLGSSDIKNHSLTGKDIKGRVRGPRGPAGAPGSAKAYADVLGNGQPNGFFTKNIVRISRPSPGLYCFYLSFQPVNVTATLDSVATGSADVVKATLKHDDTRGDKCAGVESASVHVLNINGKNPGATNAEFYVNFN
jgi:hypothetical protein